MTGHLDPRHGPLNAVYVAVCDTCGARSIRVGRLEAWAALARHTAQTHPGDHQPRQALAAARRRAAGR